MQTFEQTYPLTGRKRVSIDQGRGAVRIAGAQADEVKLRATSPSREALQERLKITHTAEGLVIKVEKRSGFFGLFGSSDDESVNLELMVPYGTDLDLDTGSGPVEVAETRGPVSLDCGSGRVIVTGVRQTQIDGGSGRIEAYKVDGDLLIDSGSGRVTAEQVKGNVKIDVGSGAVAARHIIGRLTIDTGSGSVSVDGVEGAVSIDTGSGGVTVQTVSGAMVKADTGSGSVTLKQVDTAQVSVDTGSGSITAELTAINPKGSYTFGTESGRVTVAVPTHAGLKVKLEAGGGRIDYSGLPLEIQRSDDDGVSGTLNGGGGYLSVSGAHGGIRLQPYAGAVPQMAGASQAMLSLVKGDAALQHSEHLQRVLKMVEEGKLTPDQAADLLRALDDEEEQA